MPQMDHVQRIEIMRAAAGGRLPYLENRLSMRPAGVVSKKLIGDLNIAKAILSCNFRDACNIRQVSLSLELTAFSEYY
jgi:hypothetical protein